MIYNDFVLHNYFLNFYISLLKLAVLILNSVSFLLVIRVEI